MLLLQRCLAPNLHLEVLSKGEVDNSVISRNTNIKAGSQVKNSILFPRAEIGENATVEYAILDKGVEVAEGVVIRGTAEDPIVVKKGQKVTEDIIR